MPVILVAKSNRGRGGVDVAAPLIDESASLRRECPGQVSSDFGPERSVPIPLESGLPFSSHLLIFLKYKKPGPQRAINVRYGPGHGAWESVGFKPALNSRSERVPRCSILIRYRGRMRFTD